MENRLEGGTGPSEDEEANSRICVSGWTREGRPFEEQAIIGEVRLQGARLNLKHRPKLPSTLRVVIDNPAAKGRAAAGL